MVVFPGISTVLGAMVLTVLAVGHAGAATGVALVLETQGTMTPEVQPYREILADSTITVPRGTQLVFLHYATCRTVTVSGVTVTLRERAYMLKGGSVQSELKTTCPRKVRLKAAGELGGVVTRSLDQSGTVNFSTRPTFVLVGRHADDFAFIHVHRENQVLLEAPMDGPRFQWPPEAAPLLPGQVYEMLLLPKVLGVGKVKQSFSVRAAGDQEGEMDRLVLVHLD